MTKKETAAELMARLKADPNYVAARAKEEEAREKRAAEWRRAEAPLVEELQSAGIAVESAWDLLNKAARNPKTVPILLKHLQLPYPDAVREGIARALAVPEAAFAWDRLVRLYQEESGVRAKAGLAVALAAICDQAKIGDLIAVAKDKRNGPSRLLLLSALEKSSDASAQETLVNLQSDPDLEKEIAVILRRMKKRQQKAEVKGHFDESFHLKAADLAETSMNFDANMVGAFLERLSQLIIGFGSAEIDQVLRVVDEMEVDDERELRFQVTHDMKAEPMIIRVFKDDIDAPDLYFFASPRLIEEINKQMSSFCEEHGI